MDRFKFQTVTHTLENFVSNFLNLSYERIDTWIFLVCHPYSKFVVKESLLSNLLSSSRCFERGNHMLNVACFLSVINSSLHLVKT
ncbi:hypothetical protein H5410_023578 [Solanum commersonii]|uniref:Uncharacterized protein n=1 Tax=Solanum commersonii TaxID=4109 RepID=A0A9J5ZH86_SOLCO|nr:hypothetical protein H5410_023578 [Solanum commersonii]